MGETLIARQSVVFAAKETVALRDEEILPPRPGEVLVQSIASAISPGTELLILRGDAPANLSADSSIKALKGKLAFPIKYGYTCVGRVVDVGDERDASWIDRVVFAFNPHETRFVANLNDLIAVPASVAVEEALFYPNMETAITFMLDGAPLIGEQVAVFGQGIVGLLTTALLSKYPLARLITADRYALRRETSHKLGADVSLDPALPDFLEQMRDLLQGDRVYAGADLTYELSGAAKALDDAIAITGFTGRVVIGSWYGKKKVKLDLGGAFHRSRINLISSQVSTLNPMVSGRWDRQRRMQTVWQMIRRVKPAQFITHRFAFDEAEAAYETLIEQPESAIQVILEYPETT